MSSVLIRRRLYRVAPASGVQHRRSATGRHRLNESIPLVTAQAAVGYAGALMADPFANTLHALGK